MEPIELSIEYGCVACYNIVCKSANCQSIDLPCLVNCLARHYCWYQAQDSRPDSHLAAHLVSGQSLLGLCLKDRCC